MWLFFGLGAVIFTLLNILWFFRNKNSFLFSFISLAFTSLTVCSFYHLEATRVIQEDWASLLDTMPAISKMLWFCVITSILLNAIAFIKKNK